MQFTIKNNRIFIRYRQVAFLNANIHDETTIFIDLLKVKREYRNKNYAKTILENSIDLFEKMGFKQIKLNALPLDSKGLNFEQLKDFYKKFNFFEINSQDNKNQMIKYL